MTLRERIGHLVLKYLAVPKTPELLPGKKTIACIGDSITFGAGVRGKKEKTWEYFLNEKLGSSFQVLNYGISGRTLQDEGDYPYKADKFYPITKKEALDTYLIMLGTNDAKPYNFEEERYRSELHGFLKEYLQLNHHPKVIVMTPPCVFKEEKTGIVAFDIDPDNIETIASIVAQEAKKLRIPVFDLHQHTKDHPEWFADGVHPDEKGNRAIAEYIFQQWTIMNSII